jgi:hypothetical protein
VKVSVIIGGTERVSSLPESERWIDVSGHCPSCDLDLRVIGDVTRQKIGHDTVDAPALALCCGTEVGTVHVELSTIFGLEEDERVLHGRARVY